MTIKRHDTVLECLLDPYYSANLAFGIERLDPTLKASGKGW